MKTKKMLKKEKKEDNEEDLEAEVAKEEILDAFMTMKQSPKDEFAGIGIMQPIPRKRSATVDYSHQQDYSQHKKKRNSATKTHVSTADASELIYKLAPALTKCTGGLEELLSLVPNKKLQEKIQLILKTIKDVLEIKEKLLLFAGDNKEV